MEVYFFGGEFYNIDKIYESKFTGNLFLYNSNGEDQFTNIAKNIDILDNDFRYMVAVRPYAISPQYLGMIIRSLSAITNNIEINLISGWVKKEEKSFNSFVGDTNDESDTITKSNYLINYLEKIDELKKNNSPIFDTILNVYVSTTNEFVFDAALKYDYNIIIPYSLYSKNVLNTENVNKQNIIVALGSIILVSKDDPKMSELVELNLNTDNIVCTEDELMDILRFLNTQKVKGVLLPATGIYTRRLFNFMKENRERIEYDII